MTASYHVSAYLAPPGDTAILHPTRHDHAVALWKHEGDVVELVCYWELERVSGRKHHDWPLYTEEATARLLDALLAEEGLTTDDVGAVWGTPVVETSDVIQQAFGGSEVPVHALAHLYSCLLGDTDVFRHETIVALAVDGGPDIALDAATKDCFYAGAVARRGEVSVVPVESPGPLYLAAESAFGREPGTLMALAGASPAAIDVDAADLVASTSFFGGPGVFRTARRLVGDLVDRAGAAELAGAGEDGLTDDERVASAVMKVVQRASELVAQRSVRHLLTSFDVDPTTSYLAMSGGSALNCPTNSLLVDSFGFKGLLAPPCVNDGGQALGLGLLGFVAEGVLPHRASFRLGIAYRGSDLVDVDRALEEWAPFVASVTGFDAATFCDDVERGPVAWADGRAEIGPRALGHRSLLADPRTTATKDRLNEVKQRQWWRPVAPIVLEDAVGEWFDGGRPSPSMLETFAVRADKRARVPAIVHLDGSARVQTLAPGDDEALHGAIRAFAARTGVPMLCNTSLNDKGEPIVATASQALNFCVRKGIAVAYLGGRRVALRPAGPGLPALPDAPGARQEHLFAGQEGARDAIWLRWLEEGMGPEELYVLTRSPELHARAREATGRRGVQAVAAVAARHDDFAAHVKRFVEDWGPGSSFARPPGGGA